MNAHPSYQNRWRWFALCLVLGVAATCFAAPASQTEPAEMPSDDHGDGLRAEGLIAGKLRSIVIPEVRLVDATVEEAIDFLRTRVFELDPDQDPNTRGVNIVMQPGAADEAPRINLDVRGIPAGEALRYITDLAGLTYQIDAFAVIVGPPELQRTLYTRRFQVTPDSLPIVLPEITFGEGASAFFDRDTSTLVVRNTLAELEWLDAILGGRDEESRQSGNEEMQKNHAQP